MAYRVKKQFQDLPLLRTVLEGGKVVALNQAHKRQVKGTPKTPPHEKDVPLATNEEIKKLFLAGNGCIEEVPDDPKRLENPFENYEPAFPVEDGVTEEVLEEVKALTGKKKKKE